MASVRRTSAQSSRLRLGSAAYSASMSSSGPQPAFCTAHGHVRRQAHLQASLASRSPSYVNHQVSGDLLHPSNTELQTHHAHQHQA